MQSGKKQGTSFQAASPSRATKDVLNPQATSCDNVCEMLSTEDTHQQLSALGFLIGASHVGTLCLACTKIPGSHKECKCLA